MQEKLLCRKSFYAGKAFMCQKLLLVWPGPLLLRMRAAPARDIPASLIPL